MEAISGVFKTKNDAERAVAEARKIGIPADRITLLTPGSEQWVDKESQSIPSDSTEQPGMGKAIGALAGGGVGITGGALLVALIPALARYQPSDCWVRRSWVRLVPPSAELWVEKPREPSPKAFLKTKSSFMKMLSAKDAVW